MSKRKASYPAISSSSKRTRNRRSFGDPSGEDEDALTSQLNAPSSTSLSTRALPPDHVPALTTLCARIFVTNINDLLRRSPEETQAWLKILPDAIIPPLFSMLRTKHPSLLSHPFISTFFLRGDQIVLSSTLPGVSSTTIQNISKLGNSLRNLQLIGLDNISDKVFANLLANVTALEALVLRGCTKVNRGTVNAANSSHKTLKIVNLSYTSAPAASITILTAECLELEVLKLAGVTGITNATLPQVFHVNGQFDRRPLANLRTLKLRHTSVSERGLDCVLTLCPALSRLDISFTPIRQPKLLFGRHLGLSLTKLSLTSTPLTLWFLQDLAKSKIPESFLRSLRTLHLGALGSSPCSSTLSGLLTLTDEFLDNLTDMLTECSAIENISLVGNTRLGLKTCKASALARFVTRVGRRCQTLNLGGLPRLVSSDLAGLLPLHEREQALDFRQDVSSVDDGSQEPSPLKTLVLNNTDIDDKAAQYLATCAQLQTLELAGTKLGYEPLFHILDSCTRLTHLDLTSCRRVKISDRRRIFEVWETEWKDKAD